MLKMSFFKKFGSLLIFSVFSNLISMHTVLAEGLEEFETEQVVPDVIDSVPQYVLNVTFDDEVEVNLGNILTPMQTQNKPNITWDADPDKLYVLIMIDADIPSRQEPTLREGQHYVVGNIPGDDISQGEILTEYVGSGPPKGTGLHRYIFLAFEQLEKIKFEEERLTKKAGIERAKFSTRKFANKYVLGEPMAGNFYQCEWNEDVLSVHKEHSEN